MNGNNLFEAFDKQGMLLLPDAAVAFDTIPWSKHPVHEQQLETHEVISGTGTCINNGVTLSYKEGIISIFPAGIPHEIIAGADGLSLFAKFMQQNPVSKATCVMVAVLRSSRFALRMRFCI